MRVLLDTNVLSEPLRERPDPGVMAQLERGGHALHTASVVVHALSYGIHRLAPRGFPHFHRNMQITSFKAGKLRQIIGLHIFNVVASALQHLAHQLGGNQLAGPVM